MTSPDPSRVASPDPRRVASTTSDEPGVADLISVARAIEILDAEPVSPRVVKMRSTESRGLRLAQDVLADRDYPPFDKSLMDGYAVRLADVKTVPTNLRVVGELPAGRWPDRAVGVGEAIAIMTGAPIPPGADGVVPVEETQSSGEAADKVVRIDRAPGVSRNVASRGSDCAAGRVVLTRGTKLEAAQIAVAISVGAVDVDVYARPRLAVLGTGDELVGIDVLPAPAQIRDSNTPMLVALLSRLGYDVADLGFVRDDLQTIRATISHALQHHDALFITGGMSMGEYDYVPRALLDLGVKLKITKLRIKPGKPFVFGTVDTGHGPFVFGLPGNPVAGLVCTLRLASRVLERLAGGAPTEDWIEGRLTEALGTNGPREFYQPVVRNGASVTPLKWKGSADVYTLARANGLIVRAEHDPAMAVGEVVRVLPIPM